MSSPPSNNKQSSPPNNSDLDSLNSSDNEDNNKAHSFRERRLTYTRHHVLSDNAAAAVASLLLADGNSNDFSDDDEMKKPAAQQKQDNIEEEGEAAPYDKSKEKRKLTNDNTDVDEQPKKKKKPRISIKLSANNSTTNSTTSNTNTNKKQLNHLPSRILHAGEIVRRLSEEEDSKDGDIRTGMYSHRSHPNNHHNHHNSTTEQKNKWRRRFSYTKSTPDSQLPFPRYQVGTFSCAGLEPLYDSDYGSSSSDDEESWDGKEREENGGWDKEKESDEKESDEEEDCGSSGDGGIYANNSSPSNNNNNAGRGKVLPTTNPNNKSPISPIKKQKHTTSKINQDRGGITYPYANSTNMALFSVYDGHGEGGELVSQFALGEVGRLLEERLVSLDKKEGTRGKGRLKGIAEDAEEEESDQHQDNTPKPQQQQEEEYIITSIKQVFNQIDNDLLNEEDIEPMYSGTTACIVLLKEKKLYTGNCGDSRAVLAKKKKKCHTKEEGMDVGGNESGRELITVDLSTDQNPDSPGEKERIESLGGFVSPPPEPGLSSRVWLDSSHTQIGLAMARSIGDHAVKGVGVISEPEVTIHTIDTDVDEFVIIATDGVWEFLSSEDAVGIVQKHLYSANDGEGEKKEGGGHGASVACEALIKAASDKWHEHEGNYRDDITAIVVRLKDLLR